MKKVLAITLLITLTFMQTLSFGTVASADEEFVNLNINGEYVESDVKSFIYNDRTMVPIRVISEKLGYIVEWIEQTECVVIKDGESELELFVGNNSYTLNGEKLEMDVPPMVRGDRTFVPIRLVAESLGCEVEWNEKTITVDIIKYNIVEAKDAKEFLEAINSYTCILLIGSDYNLSKVDEIENPNVNKETVFDGYEYIINGVSNFAIGTLNEGDTTICVEPRYANVLTFCNCDEIFVGDLTMGHTVEEGSCTGGVINIVNSRDIIIENCKLYGCGTYGITSYTSKDINVTDCEIYDCTYGCVDMSDTKNVRFESSIFRDCVGYDMFDLRNCSDVLVFGCDINHNVCNPGCNMVRAQNCRNIIFEECKLTKNVFETLYAPYEKVSFLRCDIDSAKG